MLDFVIQSNSIHRIDEFHDVFRSVEKNKTLKCGLQKLIKMFYKNVLEKSFSHGQMLAQS